MAKDNEQTKEMYDALPKPCSAKVRCSDETSINNGLPTDLAKISEPRSHQKAGVFLPVMIEHSSKALA